MQDRLGLHCCDVWGFTVVTEDVERLARHGRHLFKMAESHGWKDGDGEGPYEFMMRMCREVAIEDAIKGHWHVDYVRQQMLERGDLEEDDDE